MKLPQLPWLFLPSSSTPRFFDPAAQCLHNLWLPAELKTGLLCGSLGPWVFISIEDPKPQFILYNLCNGERRGRNRIDLPLTILDREGTTHDAWVRMAALSRRPSTARYTVAAVLYIGESQDATIATWELEDEHWTEIGSTPDGVSDILFYKGDFHILTSNEDLIRLVPQGPSFRMLRYQVVRSSKPMDDHYQDLVGNIVRRYLVESTAGHLLLAVKKTHRSRKTIDIRVYRLSVGEAGQARWAHYKNAAGEMLFLGPASSISCVTRSDPTIHFLDDRMEESEVELGDYFRRDDLGGLQPHVLHVSWYSCQTLDEDSRFSYRAPNDIGVTDLPTPVWCEPQSGDSTK